MVQHQPVWKNHVWHCEYSPFTSQGGKEIPAYEIFDHEGHTILMTNEDLPAVQQENIARLAALAPQLVAAAEKVIRCRDHDDLSTALRELAALLDYSPAVLSAQLSFL